MGRLRAVMLVAVLAGCSSSAVGELALGDGGADAPVGLPRVDAAADGWAEEAGADALAMPDATDGGTAPDDAGVDAFGFTCPIVQTGAPIDHCQPFIASSCAYAFGCLYNSPSDFTVEGGVPSSSGRCGVAWVTHGSPTVATVRVYTCESPCARNTADDDFCMQPGFTNAYACWPIDGGSPAGPVHGGCIEAGTWSGPTGYQDVGPIFCCQF